MTKFLINSMVVCPDMDKDYPRISHGDGIYLYDESGKKYLDGSSCTAVVANIGHGHTEIGNLIKQQIDQVAAIPTHYFTFPILDEYLEMLVSYAPSGFTKAWTISSGTEAIENAIKLALQYHHLKGEAGRYKIIGRWGSYHGNSMLALDVGGMIARRSMFDKLMHDFPHIPPAYCYRCPLGTDLSCCHLACASALETAILEEGPESVAAFIVEPVVGAALGAVPSPKGYLQEIRRICTKYGILMIADEVMTGFGRTGKNFAVDHWNIVPDIIAAGKGISAGYFPLSAIIAHGNVMKPFEDSKSPFLGGHTYSFHPLAAVVGKYVLNYILKEKLAENALSMGETLLQKLAILYRYPIVGNIRGLGLLAGIELVRDQDSKLPFPKELQISKRIGEKALQKGVILYPGKGSVDGTLGDHILIAPPLIIQEKDLDIIVDALAESIAEIMLEL
jgi:adenosylmethionine-8-amino-7-oxononanoate aminotransferase